VTAPLSIVGVRREEFEKFADFDYVQAILEGRGAKKVDTLRNLSAAVLQIAVINYESARRLEKEITVRKPDLIIADERHKIKTRSTNAAKAIHRLGIKSAYKLLLTGILITNKAIDVFSKYKFLNPAIFRNSFYSQRNRCFDMTGYGNHTPILKRTMEGKLTREMHSIAFRATKAECLDLPETADVIRDAVLELIAVKLYRNFVKGSYTVLDSGEHRDGVLSVA
jgi:hypothetical protein